MSGSGRKRTLHYDARPFARRKVTFFERGSGTYARVGEAKHGKGSIPFTPAAGPGGRRQIVALVEVDRTPAPARVVASYKAPPPQRAGRPGRLRVKRRGKSVVAKWKRADSAAGYGVVLRQRNGVQKLKRLKRGARRARFRGVPLSQGGAVTVRSLGKLGDWSRPRKARFRAKRRAPSRRLPFSELRRRPRS